MFVSCVFCVGSGFCDMLITLPEESYQVCVCVCERERDLETSAIRRPELEMDCCPMQKIK